MINYANCILLLLYINIFDERKKEKKTRQGKKEQTSQIQITYRIGVYSSIQKKKMHPLHIGIMILLLYRQIKIKQNVK